MAGEVPLVAEGGLAAVTLVGLVAVDLQRVSLEGSLLGEPAVALVAEEGSVLWESREESDEMDETGTAWPVPKWGRRWAGEGKAEGALEQGARPRCLWSAVP